MVQSCRRFVRGYLGMLVEVGKEIIDLIEVRRNGTYRAYSSQDVTIDTFDGVFDHEYD